MDDPKWRRGYALLEHHGFSFDVQTPWWHFDALAELARDFPNTQIVIVHTGLPRRPQRRRARRLARGAGVSPPRSRMSRSRFPASGGPACRGR